MKVTPAIKGQLTKARNMVADAFNNREGATTQDFNIVVFRAVRTVFQRHMPKEQAKHAANRYLRTAA